MQTKTKIIIIACVTVVIIVGFGFLVINEFQKDSEQAAEKKETEILKKESKENKKSKKEKQKPILELTQDEVSLEVGAEFIYGDFIKRAEDENGYNLKDFVKGPKAFPTDVPGKMKVTYRLELTSGENISKDLIINIIEYPKSEIVD